MANKNVVFYEVNALQSHHLVSLVLVWIASGVHTLETLHRPSSVSLIRRDNDQ